MLLCKKKVMFFIKKVANLKLFYFVKELVTQVSILVN